MGKGKQGYSMNTIQKIAKNTGIIIAGDIVNKAISLAVAIFLARYIGAVGYGKIAFVSAYLTLFGIITDLGINTILVRDISRDKSLVKKYIGNAAVIKLVLSILAIVIATIVIMIMPNPAETKIYVYIMSITLLFNSFSGLFSAIFQVNLKMGYNVFANLINRILSAGLIFWIIFSRGTILQIIIVLTLSNFIGMLINYIYSKKFVKLKFRVDFNIWKIFIREALPLAFIGFFTIIYRRVSQVMLSNMQGDAALGYYTTAINLTESLHIIPSAFMISIFPLMSEYFYSSKNLIKRTYELSFKFMLILALIIAIGTTLLSYRIITIIYGNKFLPSVLTLSILIWANVFIFLNIIQNYVFISFNKQRILTYIVIIMTFFNVTLNYIFIPKFNYIGVSVITVLTECFGFLIGFYYVYKLLNIKSLKMFFISSKDFKLLKEIISRH